MSKYWKVNALTATKRQYERNKHYQNSTKQDQRREYYTLKFVE